jgi:cell division protease FtsH
MGPERRGLIMDEDELRVTAVHEAGHALVAKHVSEGDPLHKVTIVPRGRALGLTQQLPERDRYSHSERYLHDRIAVMLGGRIAEETVIGAITTGASNDIDVATKLARQMVCDWGMSRMGPINFGQKQGEVFLGRDFSQPPPPLSQETSVSVDKEVRRIIEENYDRAKTILTEHRDQLERISEGLLEFETLDGGEVDSIMAGCDFEELRKRRKAEAEANKPPPKAEPAAEEGEDDAEGTPVLDGLPGLPEPLPQ